MAEVYFKIDGDICYYNNTQKEGYSLFPTRGYESGHPPTNRQVIIELTNNKFILPKICSYLFAGATNEYFNDMDRGSSINVEKMDYMFLNCTNLKSVFLKYFITTKVTTIDRMFQGCTSIEYIDMDSFRILPYSSGTCDMHAVFCDCTSLKTICLMNLDVSKASRLRGMFYGCTNLERIVVPENTDGALDVIVGSDNEDMFKGCEKLPNGDGTTGVSKANNNGGYFGVGEAGRDTYFFEKINGVWVDVVELYQKYPDGGQLMGAYL